MSRALSMHSGWHQVAYERDLQLGLQTLRVAGLALMVVVREAGAAPEVYEGTCPHRGALLAKGGELCGDHVRCPFHGYPVELGTTGAEGRLSVRRFESLSIGGLLFVRRGGAEFDRGFAARLRELDATHFIVPGFVRRIKASAALVIENAFDGAHFRPVHRIRNEPQLIFSSPANETFVAECEFHLPASNWQGPQANRVTFEAVAYSPTLVLSSLGGPRPYRMLTATLPLGESECETRLSLMVPSGPSGKAPNREDLHFLLRQAEAGIQLDQAIWEGIEDGGAIRRVMPADAAVQAFQAFCRGFDEATTNVMPKVRPNE